MRRALTPCLEGNTGQWPRADGCEPHSQQEGASGASGCESRKLLPLVCLLPSTLCPVDTTALLTRPRNCWHTTLLPYPLLSLSGHCSPERGNKGHEVCMCVLKCAGAQATHSSSSVACSQLLWQTQKGANTSSPQSQLSTSCLQSPAGKEQSWLCDIVLDYVRGLLHCWHLMPSWESMYAT